MKFGYIIMILSLVLLVSCQPAPRGDTIDVNDKSTFVDGAEDQAEDQAAEKVAAEQVVAEEQKVQPLPVKKAAAVTKEKLPSDVVLHLDMEETSQPGLFGVRSVKGKHGNGWAFGGDDYVQTEVDLRPLKEFTIGLWLRTDDLDQQSIILWQGAAGGDGWGATVKQPELHLSFGEQRPSTTYVERVVYYMGSQGASLRSLRIHRLVKDNLWHHVAVVVENRSETYHARIYLDGNSMLQDEDDGDHNHVLMQQMTEKLRLGKPDADTRYFRGEMDDLWIWNRALTADEIKEQAR